MYVRGAKCLPSPRNASRSGTSPDAGNYSLEWRKAMARKYSKKASADVKRAMKKRKAGTLKSGRSGKKVTSRKQAIAIGLSEARAKGKKVPKKRKAAKKSKKSKR
jgi:hypothetical protein